MIINQSKKMLDRDIRAKLRVSYLEKYYNDDNSKVVEELPLYYGAARIDIAVINGAFHGYEIKSDRDTLDRLPDQLAVYSQIFDYITVISGPKHVSHLEDFLPDFCGLMVVEKIGKESEINIAIPPKLSNERNGYMIASLLWKEEAVSMLGSLGVTKGVKTKRKDQLWTMLQEMLTIDELGEKVRVMIRARSDWRV